MNRKEGNQVFYSLRHPVLIKVLDIMRRYFQAHLSETVQMLHQIEAEERGAPAWLYLAKRNNLPGYQSISLVAAGLKTEQETLLEFHRKGWIATVQRNDVLYLAADQRYRAKYILHLSKAKNLSEEQIELVLSI